MLLILLQACEQTPIVERLQDRGILRIATVAGPLSCYLGSDGPAGLEYELAYAFAKHLRIKPLFTVYENRAEAVRAIKEGKEDMLAGFLIPGDSQRKGSLLSDNWLQTEAILVHHMGNKALNPKKQPTIAVVAPAQGYQAQLLDAYHLAVENLDTVSEEDILTLVNDGKYSYTLSNTAQIKAHANYLPELVPGKTLQAGLKVYWQFSAIYDPSLRDAANRFLQQRSDLLKALADKYIDKLPRRNYVTRRDFWKHVQTRLPKYQALFQEAAAMNGIDWRLLAAIGYQESHWKADASSPTGVRGLMMLTRDTARQQKITNRLDPRQSILGGARHLLWMEKRIPERIQGENLLWFTLASYNIGYGHLEDARILTQRQGGNPDDWKDVKQRLPLLSREPYYKTLKHGKARGREPVIYVENIRYYYELLARWDNARQGLDCTSTLQRRLALKN